MTIEETEVIMGKGMTIEETEVIMGKRHDNMED